MEKERKLWALLHTTWIGAVARGSSHAAITGSIKFSAAEGTNSLKSPFTDAANSGVSGG